MAEPPIRVLSTLGVNGILRGLLPQAEAAGFATDIRFDPTARLLAAIQGGDRGDVAILTTEGVEALVAQGVLVASPRTSLARSLIGLAVPQGAARPDISTVAALRETLLAAPSVVYTQAGASGLFFAGLIKRLGIAEAIAAKAIVIPQGFGADLVRRGEAGLAIQQVSELMAVPGVQVVGPLPAEANEEIAFAAACFTGAAPRAQAFIGWLATAMTPAVLRAGGLEPF